MAQLLVNAIVNTLLVSPSRGFQHEVEVTVDGAVAQQLEVLEDDSHLAAQLGNILAVQLGDVLVQYDSLDGALYVHLEVDGLQQRALACSHTSNQVDELSLCHVEVDILQGGLAVEVAYIDVFEIN